MTETKQEVQGAAGAASSTNQRCLCGASTHDAWTAGVHHGARRCARVITLMVRR